MRAKEQRDPSELDRQVDSMLSSRDRIESAAKGDDPLLRAGARLAKAPRPALSSEARARIHSRIQQPRRRVLQPGFAWIAQRLAAGFVLVLMLALTSIPAAANSLPGDALYPLKLGWEDAELAFARNESAELRVLLVQANRRLDEQRVLFNRTGLQGDLMERALDKMNQAVELIYRVQPAAAASLQQEIAKTYQEYQQVLNTARNQELVAEESYQDFVAMGEAVASRAGIPVQVGIAQDQPTAPEPTPDVQIAEATPPAPSLESTPEATEAPAGEEPVDAEPEATEEAIVLIHIATPEAGESAFIYARARVNIRRGPGTEFEIITTLEPDTRVNVIGTDDSSEWMQIVLEDSQTGWIAAYLLTREPSSQQIVIDTPDANPVSVPDSTSGTNPTPSASETTQSSSDFGCDRPGNACNAPGHQQQDTEPRNERDG